MSSDWSYPRLSRRFQCRGMGTTMSWGRLGEDRLCDERTLCVLRNAFCVLRNMSCTVRIACCVVRSVCRVSSVSRSFCGSLRCASSSIRSASALPSHGAHAQLRRNFIAMIHSSSGGVYAPSRQTRSQGTMRPRQFPHPPAVTSPTPTLAPQRWQYSAGSSACHAMIRAAASPTGATGGSSVYDHFRAPAMNPIDARVGTSAIDMTGIIRLGHDGRQRHVMCWCEGRSPDAPHLHAALLPIAVRGRATTCH